MTRESLRFAQVYAAVEQNYVDQVDPDRAIFDGGIRGMLSSLDPFSTFLDRSQFELLQQQTRGEALGFGSVLYVQPGKVLVLQTAQGSPSWRAGLGPGDEIVEINGARINRLDFNALVELLQQARSHPVRLGVIRPGKLVPQDFELKPAQVALPSVERAFLFSPGIGYIRISTFEQKTTQEVGDTLNRLGGQGLKGLLLDLRDNRGGMVDAAVGVASLFLKPDVPVLTMRGRAVPEKPYRTSSPPSHFDFPLVVLVNGKTASAAEVVAAALQEHDRALIVGEPSFGKGVVEAVFPLSEKTALVLTTAQYLTPSGRSIQRPLPGTGLAGNGGELQPGKSEPANHRASTFHTDNGRPVLAGGGIAPDVTIPTRTLDPWVTFLRDTGAFTRFASDYLTLHRKIDKSFEPDAKVLGNFQDFLGRERIRVPEEYWSQDQDYLKLKIKAEIFNLVFGLAVGDEVEVRGDPQVQKAASLFPKIPSLLKGPPLKPGTVRVRRGAK